MQFGDKLEKFPPASSSSFLRRGSHNFRGKEKTLDLFDRAIIPFAVAQINGAVGYLVRSGRVEPSSSEPGEIKKEKGREKEKESPLCSATLGCITKIVKSLSAVLLTSEGGGEQEERPTFLALKCSRLKVPSSPPLLSLPLAYPLTSSAFITFLAYY